jgi:NTP pyrophosphatase (non-canonical NTP hydrolase)
MMAGIAELRKQAADAGIGENGQYIEWLEEMVLELRRTAEAGWQQRIEAIGALTRQAWPEDVDGPVLSKQIFGQLLEEAGELAGVCRSRWGRSLTPDKPLSSSEDVSQEMGDTLAVLLRLCGMYKINPLAAIDGAIDKFRARLARRSAA